MKREILFRGKDCFGYWQEGSLITDNKTFWCIYNQICYVRVDEKTIGQYTGLIDKNGRKIFEGDIVICKEATEPEEKGFVCLIKDYRLKFNNVNFIQDDFYGTVNYYYISQKTEVIGNIHDNPELL
jgi:uncharacterized phage protein (TIGR01671 family)